MDAFAQFDSRLVCTVLEYAAENCAGHRSIYKSGVETLVMFAIDEALAAILLQCMCTNMSRLLTLADADCCNTAVPAKGLGNAETLCH